MVGELRAARDDAPTVLIYGHYDVQDAGDESRWTTPAFEPDIRDGRIYARGASDDKGNFLPLLLVACELADAGELGVHVRVLIEGEEETPADTAERWMAADERGADAAIVFDAGMVDADTPALTVGTRGMVWADLAVTTGERPAHSGEFGGAALNASTCCTGCWPPCCPTSTAARRSRCAPASSRPSPEELASWEDAPARRPAARGGGRAPRPTPAPAPSCTCARWPRPRSTSTASSPASRARSCPSAPRRASPCGWRPASAARRSRPALERLLRDALPEGAELELRTQGAEPSRFDPAAPALVAAQRALERACGRAPVVVRSGGSIPILSAFADRGIPTVVGGFALPTTASTRPTRATGSRASSWG